MQANLSMIRLSHFEFAVMFDGNRVGTIAKDFNNWIGYFNKDNPYRGTSENEVFLSMLREVNRFKLCGENNIEKAKAALDKFSSDVMETVKKLNKLGETETAAVVLQKVLI